MVRGEELAAEGAAGDCCGGCGEAGGEGSTLALFASAATAAVKLKKAFGKLSASKAVSWLPDSSRSKWRWRAREGQESACRRLVSLPQREQERMASA